MSIREWFKRTGPEPDPKTHLLLPITQEDAAILSAMAEDWAATPEQIVHFLIREPELIEQTNREANQEECMPQPTPPRGLVPKRPPCDCTDWEKGQHEPGCVPRPSRATFTNHPADVDDL